MHFVVLGRLLVALGSLLALATPARADAIDGDWCFEAANLFIQGANVRTPGGNQIIADYDRHGIRYVVPPNEAGAGSNIVMRLLNDDNATLVKKTSSGDAAPENWKRCKPIS
jgi:hypothetical protein